MLAIVLPQEASLMEYPFTKVMTMTMNLTTSCTVSFLLSGMIDVPGRKEKQRARDKASLQDANAIGGDELALRDAAANGLIQLSTD
jgi:hypothetical protein